MFNHLIVVELEYISRTTTPINDYVYETDKPQSLIIKIN